MYVYKCLKEVECLEFLSFKRVVGISTDPFNTKGGLFITLNKNVKI